MSASIWIRKPRPLGKETYYRIAGSVDLRGGGRVLVTDLTADNLTGPHWPELGAHWAEGAELTIHEED